MIRLVFDCFLTCLISKSDAKIQPKTDAENKDRNIFLSHN